MTVLGSNPRARVDTNHPEAFAWCDRCGFVYNISGLHKQHEWRGNNLVWTGYLVCTPCLDVPFELDRPIYFGPDPVPVRNARPSPYLGQNTPVAQIDFNGQQPIPPESDPSLDFSDPDNSQYLGGGIV